MNVNMNSELIAVLLIADNCFSCWVVLVLAQIELLIKISLGRLCSTGQNKIL